MIKIDESFADASVYKVTDQGCYLVQVNLPDLGLFIKGIRVQKSKYEGEELWVQLPSYKAGGKWIKPFECSDSGPFKQLINSLSTAAVDRYAMRENDASDTVYEPTDEELRNPGGSI